MFNLCDLRLKKSALDSHVRLVLYNNKLKVDIYVLETVPSLLGQAEKE